MAPRQLPQGVTRGVPVPERRRIIFRPQTDQRPGFQFLAGLVVAQELVKAARLEQVEWPSSLLAEIAPAMFSLGAPSTTSCRQACLGVWIPLSTRSENAGPITVFLAVSTRLENKPSSCRPRSVLATVDQLVGKRTILLGPPGMWRIDGNWLAKCWALP